MNGTVLLIGGPADGQVMEVQDHRVPYITAAVPPKDFLARYFDADQNPFDEVVPTQVTYHRRQIRMFKSPLYVYVCERFPEERVEASLIRHLLSPLAHQLIDQAYQVQV